MGLLVGFSGAAGCGKTTLVKTAGDVLKVFGHKTAIVHEVARDVFKKYFADKYDNVAELRKNVGDYAEFQLMVLSEQAYLEEKYLDNHNVVLTDRTLFDNLLYTLLYVKDVDFLSDYVNLFLEYKPFNRYNVIFLLSPLPNVDLKDGFRAESDVKSQKLQHALLKMLIPKKIEVTKTDFSTRLKIVLAYIRTLL